VWQVVGQSRVVSLLQHSLEKGSPAHAYLLIGPAHVGKMTLAINLAQALNCEASQPPCGECASCQKIALGNHADVQIIGLTSNGNSTEAKPRAEISIDQIRQVQHLANLPPFEGRYKVFIVDGAEQLSHEAANCLLKTLEEPIGRVVFILLTTNESLLPPTVTSRCQQLKLRPLAATEAEAALNSGLGIDPQKAELLARLSHGCLGWAIMAATDGAWLQQHNQQLDRLLDVINADYEERFAYASQLAAQFSQNRGRVQEILDLWLDWWRDLLLAKIGCSDTITNIDRSAELIDMARRYSLAQIKVFIGNIQAVGEQLKLNANPQLVLETLMLSIPEKKGEPGEISTAQFEVNYG